MVFIFLFFLLSFPYVLLAGGLLAALSCDLDNTELSSLSQLFFLQETLL